MFRFVTEGSEITPGVSIDKGNKILFLMFATYKHRWCIRVRYRDNPHNHKGWCWTTTYWTLRDDEVCAMLKSGRSFK